MWATITQEASGAPVLTFRDGIPTLAQLQEAVGGYIEPFFTHDTTARGGTVTGYVNDEGMNINLPIFASVRFGFLDGRPFAGPMAITGLSSHGETTALNAAQVAWLKSRWFPQALTLNLKD